MSFPESEQSKAKKNFKKIKLHVEKSEEELKANNLEGVISECTKAVEIGKYMADEIYNNEKRTGVSLGGDYSAVKKNMHKVDCVLSQSINKIQGDIDAELKYTHILYFLRGAVFVSRREYTKAKGAILTANKDYSPVEHKYNCNMLLSKVYARQNKWSEWRSEHIKTMMLCPHKLEPFEEYASAVARRNPNFLGINKEKAGYVADMMRIILKENKDKSINKIDTKFIEFVENLDDGYKEFRQVIWPSVYILREEIRETTF